jgi:hypothetical protein
VKPESEGFSKPTIPTTAPVNTLKARVKSTPVNPTTTAPALPVVTTITSNDSMEESKTVVKRKIEEL